MGTGESRESPAEFRDCSLRDYSHFAQNNMIGCQRSVGRIQHVDQEPRTQRSMSMKDRWWQLETPLVVQRACA